MESLESSSIKSNLISEIDNARTSGPVSTWITRHPSLRRKSGNKPALES